jgi:multiple sugar transport system permease protein
VPGLGPLPYYLDAWFGITLQLGRFPHQAFLTTVIMDVWHWTPLVTLTLLAALSSMPKEPFEQAQIDGANRFQIFWHITLPLLKPALLATVFIRMMDALRTVDEVWMLTGGGPGSATRYIGLHIWRVVFPKTDYGYGSAMSLLTLYFTIVMCWLLYAGLMARRDLKREAE